MLRPAELARFGGIPPVVTHAQALATRAWQPFRGYVGYADGYGTEFHMELLDIDLLAALYDVRCLGAMRGGAATLLPVPDGDPGDLPSKPIDRPQGHESHPAVIAMAQAIAAAVPAVVWAIQEQAVPEDLAAGDLAAARTALADLLVTASDRFREYRIMTEWWAGACGVKYANSDAARDFAAVLLEPYGEHSPIELPDDWHWLVSIGTGEDDGGDQMEPHTLRCFAALDRAQRFAVLQADYTRDLVDDAVGGHPRSALFMKTVVQPLVDYDGTGSISVHEPDSEWRTTITARDRSPLPPLPARAAH